MANLDLLIAKAKAHVMTAAERRDFVIGVAWVGACERGLSCSLDDLYDAYDKSERERNT